MHEGKSKFKIHLKLKRQNERFERWILPLQQMPIFQKSESRVWLAPIMGKVPPKFFRANGSQTVTGFRDELSLLPVVNS
jgi:hypothetical protein